MFFELDDVKRRHNPTWWTNNTTAWHTAVDSTPSWNYQRGAAIGLISCTIQQYFSHLVYHMSAMRKHYEPPTNITQAWTFLKQTRNLQSFKSGLKSRLQLGLASGLLPMGATFALFRQFNSGWSNNFAGFEWNWYRKAPTIILASVLASPLGVAVDMVQRAYNAEKTFPKELRKGYKSYFDAFKRIPFEEGPYYLYRNTFPLFAKHILLPMTALFSYDWMMDKLSILWRATNVPVLPIQMFAAGVATFTGLAFTYPITVTAQHMVDLWPKTGGVDAFEGNYRKAFVHIWFSPSLNDYYPGFFKNYFWHVFPQWFIGLIVADKLGLFKYWKIDIFSGSSDNNNEDSFI